MTNAWWMRGEGGKKGGFAAFFPALSFLVDRQVIGRKKDEAVSPS